MWRSPAACSCESSTCIGVSSISTSPASGSSSSSRRPPRPRRPRRRCPSCASTTSAGAGSSGSAARARRAPGRSLVGAVGLRAVDGRLLAARPRLPLREPSRAGRSRSCESMSRLLIVGRRSGRRRPVSRRAHPGGGASDRVAQLVTLRLRGSAVLGVRRDLDRHLLDHGQPVAVEPADLLRVVREDADRRQAEVGEDLVADPVLARVRREAELEVRLDGVEAVLLQLVRAQLVQQADAAALLRHVEQHAALLGLDPARAPARAARRSRSAASGRRRRSGTRSGRGRARSRAPSTSPLTSATWCLPVSISR